MSNAYIRLATPPALNHPGYPTCDACDVEVELDDGWLCPSCGTAWPAGNMEAGSDEASLYPDWAGEDLTGPICPNDEAWRFAHLPPDERDTKICKLANPTIRAIERKP